MSATLLRRTLAAGRWRLIAVSAGLAAWGFVLPVIYATFGADFRRLVESGYFADLFELFTSFGGGTVFTLSGSVALGFIHPIAIALVAVFAIGFPALAIAGERQRGTLEVLLARPLSRRAVYWTALAATWFFVVAVLIANTAGVIAGSLLFGVAGELDAGLLALTWLNATVLFGALGSLALAASASFDRPASALGIMLAVAIAAYAVEFLGAIWPDLAWLLPWSLFHYFQPAEILGGTPDGADLVVLVAVAAAATAYGLWVFPRRDLAAPS
jgi:ABC-2 type transport system permease protein